MNRKATATKMSRVARIGMILFVLLLFIPGLIKGEVYALPGAGTEANPYTISTRAELVEFLDSGGDYEGQFVVLLDDIVAGEVSPKSEFKGTFDGKGYEISELNIEGRDGALFRSAEDEIGLFKLLSGNAVVKNLHLSGRVTAGEGFTLLSSDSNNIGAISGKLEAGASIVECSFVGNVEGKSRSDYVGGIVGNFAGGSIVNCSAGGGIGGAAAVYGRDHIGGIAGSQSGTIINSGFEGTVDARRDYAGGIAGSSTGGTIEKCHVNAQVSGSTKVGGIAGQTAQGSTIQYCLVEGSVTGTGGSSTLIDTQVGGIVGRHLGIICTSQNNAAVSGKYSVGGITGTIVQNGGRVGNCLNTGNVTANNSQGGGIAGNMDDKNNCLLHKNVNLGTVNTGTGRGSILGSSMPGSANAKYNFYQDGVGPGGANGTVHGAAEYKAFPVGGSFSWANALEYLNESTGSSCGEDAFYLDPENDWLPALNLDGEGPPAMRAKVRITTGKEYVAPENLWSTSEVSITGDSAFTVAYEFQVDIGCAPADLELSIKKGSSVLFPAGTSIIISVDGSFYYHNVSEGAQKLLLGDFYRMGTTEKYSGPAAGGEDERDYMVIVDFADVAPKNRLLEGIYELQLMPPQVAALVEYARVEITEKQIFEFDYTEPINGFRIKLIANPEHATGYDHQIQFKPLALEFYLTLGDGEGAARWPLPVGSSINGIPVTAEVPYHILPISLTGYRDYTILLPPDTEIGEIPLFANGIAYAANDEARPRGGHILEQAYGGITFRTPEKYALKTTIDFTDRYLDWSDSSQTVSANLDRIGSGTSIKTTMQKKVDGVYSDVAGQVDRPIFMSANPPTGGETIDLTVPAGTPKGTYRFLISLYDSDGRKRAQTIENIIVK